MTTHAPVPPWGLAVAAMLSVQLGSALSVHLISTVGPAGTAWLRLSAGAVILLALARPPLSAVRRRDLPALLGLGVTTGLVTIAFLAAIEHIPLGTAVAIEFLGPLTVAALRSHSTRALVWPALALTGVVLLTEPWHGHIEPAGLGFAALAAVGWGTYILLTQRIGDRFTGIGALSLTVPVAAATAAVAGIPQAAGQLTPGTVAAAAGLAVLLPVLPFACELLALRKMTPTAFGTLMALEPAIGVLLGLAVLHQQPSITQIVGILLVVLAGTAAQRTGRRLGPATEHADPKSASPGQTTPDPAATRSFVPEQRSLACSFDLNNAGFARTRHELAQNAHPGLPSPPRTTPLAFEGRGSPFHRKVTAAGGCAGRKLGHPALPRQPELPADGEGFR